MSTQAGIPEYRCIHQLFEAEAKRVPENIAVVFGDQVLTYSELNARANRLAHRLVRLGVGPGALVAIYLERSIEMLVAVLATLKSRAAYVPLDPAFPRDRIQFMLSDCKPRVILTQAHLRAQFPLDAEHFVVLGSDGTQSTENRDHPDSNIDSELEGKCLAYVIYTSGSTGRPKGVQIRHQSVVNFLLSMIREPGISESDRLLAITTLSFDIAALELFLPLSVGAQVQIVPRATAMNSVELARLIEDSGATLLQATPTTWRLLIAAGWQGKRNLKSLCGGESLPRDLADQLLDRSSSVWNLYGPTETTIWSSLAKVEPGPGPVMIGRPIANTQMYVLNSSLVPQPIGMMGELFIGGMGLAQGYLNSPDLTQEKFISNPFGSSSDELIYRTGDLARYSIDGQLECLGRVDDQVKIRGYRIELGEIEAVLREQPSVKEAVVVVREDQPGDPRIIAYVCLSGCEKGDLAAVQSDLRKRLPDYMLPSKISVLASLPLTPNGKIDRRNLPLPPPDNLGASAKDFTENEDLEDILQALWKEVLQVEAIGSEDNFFRSGGTSLQSVILVSRINQKLGQKLRFKLSLPKFLKAPTLAGLANQVRELQIATVSVLSSGSRLPPAGCDTAPGTNLAQEARLDPSIYIDSSRGTKGSPSDRARPIFFTGATGFLGAFLLSDLLKETDVDIYCLIRGSTLDEAKKRIRDNLTHYSVWREEFSPRIRPLLGDLALPQFGLQPREYDRLGEEVGVVYHNGALVNFLFPYSKLKAANVTGTEEIIRFASRGRLKPLHYTSTISVFDSWRYDRKEVILESDEPVFSDGFFNGYAESKWVSEGLVKEARSRGLPVSIYRPGMITGSSVDGHLSLTEFFARFIKGCAQIGCVPDLDIFLDIVPVDFVSKAITLLSLHKESLGKTFHLVNPNPVPIGDLFRVMTTFGYSTETKSYPDWLEAVTRQPNHDQNALAIVLPLLSERKGEASLTIPEYFSRPHRAKFDCSHTLDHLKDTSLVCPRIDKKLFETYLDYFVRAKFLPQIQKFEELRSVIP